MSESLADLFFPTFYEKGKSGGNRFKKEAADTLEAGVKGSTAWGSTVWERLNERDEETGAPVGYLAIKREQLTRRLQKMIAPRYGRRMQFA